MDKATITELVSAALDGDRVDLGALRAALAAPEGRDTLAAFVLIRAATAADEIEAGDNVVHTVEEAVRRDAAGICPTNTGMTIRRSWYLTGPRVPATWAAALALIAVTASVWGALTFRVPATTLVVRAPAPAAAPIPAVVPPAAATPNDVERTVSARPLAAGRRAAPRPVVAQPPTPTRVLRFVPGVDWVSGAE